MIQSIQLPTAGQRIGAVSGPGSFASDNAGVVLTRVESKWGDYVVVLMDNGTTETCHSLNVGPGIGWHAL